MELNKIYCGNCVDIMSGFPDACIDLTVTSPPYDNLRDYNGYTFEFEKIAQQLYRVTKVGGVVVWVVGDSTSKFQESMTSFKQVFYFVNECGFGLLDTMIYYKQNYAPAYPTLRRYANQFEYMFVFSKGKPKTFNAVQRAKVFTEIVEHKSSFRQKDGSLKKKSISVSRATKDASNVWEFQVGGKSNGHPAPFPEQLAHDHIISWSNPGDIVLDPMCGSGTTCAVAKKLGRSYIGIDISEEYCEIAENRIGK